MTSAGPCASPNPNCVPLLYFFHACVRALAWVCSMASAGSQARHPRVCAAAESHVRVVHVPLRSHPIPNPFTPTGWIVATRAKPVALHLCLRQPTHAHCIPTVHLPPPPPTLPSCDALLSNTMQHTTHLLTNPPCSISACAAMHSTSMHRMWVLPPPPHATPHTHTHTHTHPHTPPSG